MLGFIHSVGGWIGILFVGLYRRLLTIKYPKCGKHQYKEGYCHDCGWFMSRRGDWYDVPLRLRGRTTARKKQSVAKLDTN